MRRALVLAVLSGLMFSLHALRVEATGARDPMVLVTIGFVLLASFTLAELGSGLGLPRVTGYILAGVGLGPSIANVLSRGVVQEMRMFNTLALGLIATGAGLELDVRQIAKIFRTLAATILVKVVLGVALVTGAFLAGLSAFHSLTFASHSQAYGMAIVMGVLSIGTSPAIALAVMTESRAKGRLMDLVLGAAIAKDIVVVVCLAVAIAVARPWVGAASHAGEHAFRDLVTELGSSLLAGGALGLLLILYIRLVRAEMLLFVAAMILVTSEVGRTLHLELLLVFITAGFVVRNFSEHEHELMPAVQMVALPVFVVFFTIAGAGVDLRRTWQVLPLAALLTAARAVAYRVASGVGGAVGGESEVVRTKAWLGYLPQAGVTLGLVGVASHQLPEIAPQLETLGMAVIAINLLIGPITLKRALGAAGEIPDARALAPEAQARPDHGHAEDRSEGELVAEDEARRRLERLAEGIRPAPLRALTVGLEGQLAQRLGRFRAEQLEPWGRTVRASIAQALARDAGSDAHATLVAWAAEPHADDVGARAAACRSLFQDLRESLRALPETVDVELEEENRKVRAGDSLRVRWRKRRAGLARVISLRGGRGIRRVPTQLVARTALEPRLAATCGGLLSAWCRTQASIIEELRRHVLGTASAEEVLRGIDEGLEVFLSRFESDGRAAIVGGLEAMSAPLNHAGGPVLPAAEVRFSAAEPAIKAALARFEEDPGRWASVLEATLLRLRLHLDLAELDASIGRSLEETVLGSATEALRALESVLTTARDGLQAVQREVVTAASTTAEQREALVSACRAAYPEDAERRLEAAAAAFRSAASVHGVAREARRLVEQLPANAAVPSAATPPERAAAPGDVRVDRIPVRDRIEHVLVRRLFPALDQLLQEEASRVATTGAKIREAVDIFLHALGPHGERLDEETRAEIERVLDRGVQRLNDQLAALTEGRGRATSGVRDRARTAFRDLEHVVEAERPAMDAAAQLGERLRRKLSDAVAPLVERGEGARDRVRSTWARLVGSEFRRDVSLRSRKDGVDATEIRDLIERLGETSRVPAEYAGLFAQEPVREHRLFTANREALAAVLEGERRTVEGRRGAALVVGLPGSGRTSLLNLCELEVSAPRIVRPEPLEWRRSIGVEAALAIDLGLGRRRKLDEALREARTTVLLDDLEQWFTPDEAGMAALGRLLELIVRTDDQVYWIVTIDRGTLALLEELVPIRPAFTRVVALGDLGPEELAHAIEGRHLLSGREIRYPGTFLGALLSRVRWSDDRSVYFGVLARLARGNLRAALFGWLRSIRLDEGRVVPELNLGLTGTLSLLTELSVRQLAALGQLSRFGPMSEAEIARALAVPDAEARRHLHFLLAAGILERDSTAQGRLRIVRRIQPMVHGALDQVGALRWR